MFLAGAFEEVVEAEGELGKRLVGVKHDGFDEITDVQGLMLRTVVE
jgi:hypothetical protein